MKFDKIMENNDKREQASIKKNFERINIEKRGEEHKQWLQQAEENRKQAQKVLEKMKKHNQATHEWLDGRNHGNKLGEGYDKFGSVDYDDMDQNVAGRKLLGNSDRVDS